jgi:hypothetical protein
MVFRRFRSVSGVSPLMAALPRVPSRTNLLAERERLAIEERRAVERVEQLRSRLDDLSNALDRPGPSSAQPIERRPQAVALAIVNAGRRARNEPP